MNAILQGEKCTPDTLLVAEVTPNGVNFEIFDGVKGKVKITLSEEKWSELAEYIHKECERFQELKKPVTEAHTGGNSS